MFQIPLLLTIYAGFAHAFEMDHLLAVSNIVSQRNNTLKSLKDGLFWGLGHTSTILFIGVIMLILKVNIDERYFHLLEAGVGIMLIVLGVYRLSKLRKVLSGAATPALENIHCHSHALPGGGHQDLTQTDVRRLHLVSYGVGMVHGLAGSGELVLLVLLQMASPQSGLLYLLIFGIGSILGMLVAATMFSAPFSKRILQARILQIFLIVLSSLLCLGFGISIIYENVLAV